MVMNEYISRLMDGEVDPQEFDHICAQMKAPEALDTWVCYHLIGDHLRGAHGVTMRFSARFCGALAAEPTVLAPQSKTHAGRGGQVATAAWAVAATLAAVTVVGWTAFSMLDAPPTAVARAREASTVRAAQAKPLGEIPADYLIAHQEYSPSVAMQGGPYLRAVAVSAPETEQRP
jgi:sigma-E factor negative regulatory protein RseA